MVIPQSVSSIDKLMIVFVSCSYWEQGFWFKPNFEGKCNHASVENDLNFAWSIIPFPESPWSLKSLTLSRVKYQNQPAFSTGKQWNEPPITPLEGSRDWPKKKNRLPFFLRGPRTLIMNIFGSSRYVECLPFGLVFCGDSEQAQENKLGKIQVWRHLIEDHVPVISLSVFWNTFPENKTFSLRDQHH